MHPLNFPITGLATTRTCRFGSFDRFPLRFLRKPHAKQTPSLAPPGAEILSSPPSRTLPASSGAAVFPAVYIIWAGGGRGGGITMVDKR